MSYQNVGGHDAELDRAVVACFGARARWQAALDLNVEVIAQIVDTPARTIEGLSFKVQQTTYLPICRATRHEDEQFALAKLSRSKYSIGHG